jgi:hypothetical protein
MKHLLVVSALLEAATGIGLFLSPSLIVNILLGADLGTAGAVTIARVAGASLVALGLACWRASHDTPSHAARGVVVAMLLYNGATVAVLLHAVIGLGLLTAGTWLAAGLHAAMAVWCVAVLRRQAVPGR